MENDNPTSPEIEALRAELEAKHAEDLARVSSELERRHDDELAKRSAELEAANLKALDDQKREFEAAIDDQKREFDLKLETAKTPTEPPPARGRPEPPAPDAVFITREVLLRAGACQLRTFDSRAGDDEGFYWTPDEVRRVYEIDPRFLRFYEYREIVPMLEAEGVPPVAERRRELVELRAKKAARRAHVARRLPGAMGEKIRAAKAAREAARRGAASAG